MNFHQALQVRLVPAMPASPIIAKSQAYPELIESEILGVGERSSNLCFKKFSRVSGTGSSWRSTAYTISLIVELK